MNLQLTSDKARRTLLGLFSVNADSTGLPIAFDIWSVLFRLAYQIFYRATQVKSLTGLSRVRTVVRTCAVSLLTACLVPLEWIVLVPF